MASHTVGLRTQSSPGRSCLGCTVCSSTPRVVPTVSAHKPCLMRSEACGARLSSQGPAIGRLPGRRAGRHETQVLISPAAAADLDRVVAPAVRLRKPGGIPLDRRPRLLDDALARTEVLLDGNLVHTGTAAIGGPDVADITPALLVDRLVVVADDEVQQTCHPAGLECLARGAGFRTPRL